MFEARIPAPPGFYLLSVFHRSGPKAVRRAPVLYWAVDALGAVHAITPAGESPEAMPYCDLSNPLGLDIDTGEDAPPDYLCAIEDPSGRITCGEGIETHQLGSPAELWGRLDAIRRGMLGDAADQA